MCRLKERDHWVTGAVQSLFIISKLRARRGPIVLRMKTQTILYQFPFLSFTDIRMLPSFSREGGRGEGKVLATEQSQDSLF